MGVDVLGATVSAPTTTVLSLDIFDTILLRDGTTQVFRFAEAASLAAARLGVDARALAALRMLSHDNAYRAIQMERPGADASLPALCQAATEPLGLGDHGAAVLAECEIEADIARLRPSRVALDTIAAARAQGMRVIAVSDTWYSSQDLDRMLRAVVGSQPFDAIYSSAELGASKHAGGIFAKVAALEGREPHEFMHAGDTEDADLTNPTAAGWNAVHVPRERGHELARLGWKLRTLPLQWRVAHA